VWAKDHKGLAIGGGVVAGSALVTALVVGAIPLWKKIVQPYIEKLRAQQAQGKGKVQKRSVEDEYLDTLIADEDFVNFLEGLNDQFDAEF
jgi:hypothetical protein